MIVNLRYLLDLVDCLYFEGDVRWLSGIVRRNGSMRSHLNHALPDFKEANYLINPSYIVGAKQNYLFNIIKS